MTGGLRNIGWFLVLLVVVGSLVAAVTTEDPPATDDERAYELKANTLCPECQGQNVLESNAPVAGAIRRQIDDLVDEGRSDDEIRRLLALQYGEDVNTTPPRSGLGAMVWVLPVVAVALGGLGLVVSFRRWRAGRGVAASDEDRELVDRLRSGR